MTDTLQEIVTRTSGGQFEPLFAPVRSELADKLTLDALRAIRVATLGKKGTFTEALKKIGALAPEERKSYASQINAIKGSWEQALDDLEAHLVGAAETEALARGFLDPALPPLSYGVGQIHPLTIIERQIYDLLAPFGFQMVYGPEIEEEYFCFDSLNIPQDHPARDMQDTFYLDVGRVLRTHTTSVQARELAATRDGRDGRKLPLKVVSSGRVFRNESEDATHTAMFHQFELVWVEEGLTLANLVAIIHHVVKGVYGKRRKVRLVPKHYPYTEPSLGVTIDCSICHGSGCSSCGHSGWVTVAGAGMVHRKVLEEFSFDPEKVSGFAFGFGTTRLAGQLVGLPTLKMVYDNDLRRLPS